MRPSQQETLNLKQQKPETVPPATRGNLEPETKETRNLSARGTKQNLEPETR